jgi:hypothetical protein
MYYINIEFDIKLRHTTYKHLIFYIVMDEITRFTSCMCYEACPTNVGKITFCCSDSSQNQDTFVVTLILGMWNNEKIMKKEIIQE